MFGIQQQDIDLCKKIWDAGLTVDQASEMRKQGTLPESLMRAWANYDLWLDCQEARNEY